VNRRLVDALVAPDVPFLVIGGTATQFHRAKRAVGDVDFVVGPSVESGQRLLVALHAVGVPATFTPEQYAGSTCVGLKLKPPLCEFNADLFKAEPWFEFEKRWNEAHEALLFDRPVKVATKDALIVWIEHAKDPEEKHLRDLELLRDE